tara:strand:+ start:352 stop:996 length:645 start_codon:yes stop_codon:yes gene_type:complete
MVNYQNGLIYKLVSNDLNIKECYYGSTTNFIERRKAHKRSCSDVRQKGYNQPKYKFIRDNGNWENWKMVMVKYFPCNSKLELEREERFVMEQDDNRLNVKLPTRTRKEWDEDNKEKILEQKKEWYENNKEQILKDKKEYYENNKEKIAEYNKEYNEKNKEKILEQKKERYENNKEQINEKRSEKVTCECGLVLTKSCLSRHKRSQKHLKFIENK